MTVSDDDEPARTIMVSKLDAARRQLDAAVRLYFAEGDPVAIHTLAAAAHEVLADISVRRNVTVPFIHKLLSLIRPEKQAEARAKFNRARNFFKHAKNDPEESIEFDPAHSEFLLFDACTQYRELTGELVPALGVFQAWFWIAWDKLVDHTPNNIIDQFRSAVPSRDRRTFFAECMALVTAELARGVPPSSG